MKISKIQYRTALFITMLTTASIIAVIEKENSKELQIPEKIINKIEMTYPDAKIEETEMSIEDIEVYEVEELSG